MLQRTGEAETITTHYLFALGLYRALYIPNWLYRYFTEGYVDPIPWVAGTIQTILYSDFFWIYYTKYVVTRLSMHKSLVTSTRISISTHIGFAFFFCFIWVKHMLISAFTGSYKVRNSISPCKTESAGLEEKGRRGRGFGGLVFKYHSI